MEYLRKESESFLDWKLRLIKSKIEKTCDLDWAEIKDLLNLDCSADHLRKTAYGIYEYAEYFDEKLKENVSGVDILSENAKNYRRYRTITPRDFQIWRDISV